MSPEIRLAEGSVPYASRLEALVDRHRALGDTTRMRLLGLLKESDRCVGDLARAVGLTESAVSRQLRELRLARLVRTRRQKRFVVYSLADADVCAMLERAMAPMNGEAVIP